LTGWTVELTPAARRQYRQLEDGPKSAAKELLEDLEAEGPELVPALELRGKPRVWRARFHNDYRMIYQIAKAGNRIIVTRIKPPSSAYEGIKR